MPPCQLVLCLSELTKAIGAFLLECVIFVNDPILRHKTAKKTYIGIYVCQLSC